MQGILGLQSSYSMLKSMIPLNELVKLVKDNNYSFIALSDTKLHGTYDLYKLAVKHDIKPILGLRVNIIEPYESEFVIYVKNKVGYENLLKISSLIEFNSKLSLQELITYQKGLIFVSGGYNSIIDKTIIYGNEDSVLEYLKSFKNNFDDFYIGLSLNHDIQSNSAKVIEGIAAKYNYKLLPLHFTNYLLKEDKTVYETFIKIDNNNNKLDKDVNYNLLSLEDINSTYGRYMYLENDLNDFINSIEFILEFPKFELPEYETNDGVSAKDYLISLAKVGLKRRLQLANIKNDKVYINRLDHELKTIIDLNFENYFLVVYDFIKYAKSNNILVGPGRGSAAGSLVSYCLGITNIDPIKYNLLFERFLNPARTSMPDIDIDFPDNKREEVIEYVRNKYGNNHICSITTFSSLALRSSVRDIARVLQLPNNRVEGIIQSALSNDYDTSDSDVSNVINTASKIEGLYRQTGTHAAGIILSKQDLTKYIPMQVGSYDFNQSQFDAKVIEKLGLNKIDFLGIKNLTIISNILDELKKNNINVDINNLDLNDNKTFELLSKGDTSGVFQLESSGMRNVLSKLKPRNFEDIVATLALFRPGPMENIDIYIKRRNGGKFNYLHKDLESILKSTFGIIIYQEQIMQIAVKYAGYSLFDADMLRVGVSKKDINILNKERSKFVSSAITKGHSESLSNEIYDYIVKFADYGFNRSHSVSYGLVSYQMAYLKANYYLVFIKELLNNVIGNEYQTNLYLTEARANNIEVLPPDLLLSSNTYEIIDNKLIMPLNAIKGFGVKITNEIISNRNSNKINNLYDCLVFLEPLISDTQFTNLIYSGALDFIGINRHTLIKNSSLDIVKYQGFISDFVIKPEEDYSFSENSVNEKQALGVNVKYDLLSLINQVNPKPNKYKTISNMDTNLNTYYLIGVVESIKEHLNKNNELMYFITITDGNNTIDVTVFSDNVKRFGDTFNDKISIFLVRKNNYNNKVSYILDNIANL